MTARVVLACEPGARVGASWLARTAGRLESELGCEVLVGADPDLGPVLPVRLRELRSPTLDMLELDSRFHRIEHPGGFTIVLGADDERTDALAALQVLTRYQRLLPIRDALPPVLERVLARHRSLFDLSKPLVRADYDHALDTWRWVRRLDPGASLAVQLAALFHDIERLRTEADARIEQHAPSYAAFKQAHASSGAAMVGEILELLRLDPALIRRTCELVAQHERPGADDELKLLNDADALSFFSLNAWGFRRYFGLEHTRFKVAYTLSRMRAAARARVPELRHHPDMREMIHRATVLHLPVSDGIEASR